MVEGILVKYTNRTGKVRTESGLVKLKFKKKIPGLKPGLCYKFEGPRTKDWIEVLAVSPSVDGRLDPEDWALLFPGINPEELGSAMSAAGIQTVSDLFKSDPGIEKISELLGSEKADIFAECIRQIERNTEIQAVWSIADRAGLRLDIPQIVRLVDFFSRRAKRNNTTVAELIKNCPWIILHVPDVFSRIKEALEAADAIAGYLGRPFGADRVISCAAALVARKSQEGHAYIPFQELYKKIQNYCPYGKFEFQSLIATGSGTAGRLTIDKSFSESMAEENEFFAGDGSYRSKAVYLSRVYFEEKFIAKRLNTILKENTALLPESVSGYALEWAEKRGIKFNPAQENLIRNVMNNKITVLRGGAGSGKTTVLKALIYGLHKSGVQAALLAPTGIAAQRLAAESETPYHTIHRYSRIYQDGDLFFPEEDIAPNVSTGDRVVIVDEMSMATVPVIAKLLSISDISTRFVFSGDESQLPPIGPGGVFDALIKADDLFAVIDLPGCYRQQSETVKNALNIRAGTGIIPGAKTRIVPVDSKHSTQEALLSMLTDKEHKDIQDIFVLARRKEEVRKLNRALRKHFLGIDNGDFAPGDYIITVRNDYEDFIKISNPFLRRIRELRHSERPTIYNGTRGVIKQINENTIIVEFLLPGGNSLEAEYNKSEINWYIEHAFAMTVHKAQGGQAREVYFIEPEPEGLTQAMLYTAFTRCTESITLIGGRDVESWNNFKPDPVRFSKLYWRIKEEAQKNRSE
ncbi:ATP-dependent RecD-like DNA helicase [Koleobacter methoxysyntrophicus]|uniref:ATP-dependent RecD-like DNA helicase n=1 Tax=Koleobacter methoxysyntrophicus TaxID=2751313 RepID=A0A8A0RQG7_9FIRM|nr:AAA family ATPase [Koleobacter methoxysyntrophicus]QSQ10503.1 ATP-dependent RecD-like DNA helicase [Koleobacter methoxysyntrophicus]